MERMKRKSFQKELSAFAPRLQNLPDSHPSGSAMSNENSLPASKVSGEQRCADSEGRMLLGGLRKQLGEFAVYVGGRANSRLLVVEASETFCIVNPEHFSK